MQHGTTYAYLAHKCRCPKCRAAQAAYMREYRAALKGARPIRKYRKARVGPPAVPWKPMNDRDRARARAADAAFPDSERRN